MREGVILVEGDVGDDAGLAMRRGLIAIAGAAGDGLGRGHDRRARSSPSARSGRLRRGGDEAGDARPVRAPRPVEARPPAHVRAERAGPAAVPDDLPPAAAATGGSRCRSPLSRARSDRYNGDLVERGQGEILIAS